MSIFSSPIRVGSLECLYHLGRDLDFVFLVFHLSFPFKRETICCRPVTLGLRLGVLVRQPDSSLSKRDRHQRIEAAAVADGDALDEAQRA